LVQIFSSAPCSPPTGTISTTWQPGYVYSMSTSIS
jgi:hypothetical protein